VFCTPSGLAVAVALIGVSGSYTNPHRAPPAKIPTDAGPKEWAAFMDVWGPRPPWQVYRSPHRTVECLRWDGTVLAVSDRSIEVLRDVDDKPIRYPAHFLLATGRVLAWEMESQCFLLEDVKVGDQVIVAVGTEDEGRGEECFLVSIRRRPGGKIPPSRTQTQLHPYHVQQQAKIDLIEKGTPLPDYLWNTRIPPLKPVSRVPKKPAAPPARCPRNPRQ
jgi:hypothetical protein